MATGARTDPYRGFNFRIEIDGIERGGFREASGPRCVARPDRVS